LVAIMRAVRNDFELFQQLEHVEGRHATVDELSLVHDRAYVESVRALCAAGGGRLDIDTVASEGSWMPRRPRPAACSTRSTWRSTGARPGVSRAFGRPVTTQSATARWVSASSEASRWARTTLARSTTSIGS